MLVMNCTQEEQTFKALGNWFTFKPGQIKNMQDNIALYIRSEKKMYGLAILPDAFEEPDYRDSEEGKAELDRVRQEGLRPYLTFHRDVIRNNQVSLRMDLEKANIKADPAIYASDGEIYSMELMAKYKKWEENQAQKKADHVKDLLKVVGKD